MSKVTWKWHGPLFAGCAFLSVAATADAEYRLAGTIELDTGRNIAILDDGNGLQQIVRVGDHLDIGEIHSIGNQKVVFETDRGLVVLSLEGLALPSEPAAEMQALIANMVVNPESLHRLKRIAGDDERRVTEEVLKELELPKELIVREVWVGEKRFSQMHLALPDIRGALQAGDMAHVFFEEGGKVDEIYLMSAMQTYNNE